MSQTGSVRRTAGSIVVLLAASIGLSQLACDDAPVRDAEALAERVRAAEAGVDWMLGHWREMPPGWAYANLSRLSRVVSSGPRAARIDEALREDLARGDHPTLPPIPLDAEIRDPRRLTPILLELQRRRDNDLPWREHAGAIGAMAADDELGFWKSIPLRQRSTVVHLFEELEIATAMHLEAVTEALRQAAAKEDERLLAVKTSYIYAITHVVLARSGYFRQLADPTGLEFTIPVLRGALEYRLARPVDVFALDQICEILASLQLLGVPDDALTERARTQVVALQNADGSWGTGDGAARRKIHPTFNAIVGLLDLQAVLPGPGAGARDQGAVP